MASYSKVHACRTWIVHAMKVALVVAFGMAFLASMGRIALAKTSIGGGDSSTKDNLESMDLYVNDHNMFGPAAIMENTIKPLTDYFALAAISVFVIKVVLTAVDRFVLMDTASGAVFRLTEIPIIGAYVAPGDAQSNKLLEEQNKRFGLRNLDKTSDKDGYTWKNIFMRFAKNIAVIASVWVVIRLIYMFVFFLISSV